MLFYEIFKTLIITELYDGQGLGNQLWVYAVSRSIAEKLNVPFILKGADRFKGNGFLSIELQVGISAERAVEELELSNWITFHEAVFYDRELDYLSSGFDSRVLSLRGAHKIDGLFQSEKYFFGNMKRLQKYFILDDAIKSKHLITNDTCIINLRGGEYKRHKRFILPASYWITAIENMKRMTDVRKFLVVTDDVRYARAMFPKFDVLEGGIEDCYASIFNAKHLILSNSTFSYFPVKTGRNDRIVIAPKYWARYADSSRRWASPANLYESWLWQGIDGHLHTYDECYPECRQTEAEYEADYFVRTTQDQVLKHGLKRFLPASLRSNAKRVLSLLFPRHIG